MLNSDKLPSIVNTDHVKTTEPAVIEQFTNWLFHTRLHLQLQERESTHISINSLRELYMVFLGTPVPVNGRLLAEKVFNILQDFGYKLCYQTSSMGDCLHITTRHGEFQ